MLEALAPVSDTLHSMVRPRLLEVGPRRHFSLWHMRVVCDGCGIPARFIQDDGRAAQAEQAWAYDIHNLEVTGRLTSNWQFSRGLTMLRNLLSKHQQQRIPAGDEEHAHHLLFDGHDESQFVRQTAMYALRWDSRRGIPPVRELTSALREATTVCTIIHATRLKIIVAQDRVERRLSDPFLTCCGKTLEYHVR